MNALAKAAERLPARVSRLVPGAAFAGLSAYKVPHHPAPIDLILHGNEGPPTPPELVARVAAEAAAPERVRRYPSAAALEAALAARLGVEPARVLVTAGADDALDRTFRVLLAPATDGRLEPRQPREVVLAEPTFVMLPHYARVMGATVRSIPWPAEDFPAAAVEAAIGPQTGVVACVSPNNPTGAIIGTPTICGLAERHPTVAILVDGAYVEMADEDPTAAVLAYPNVLVFRTFSKAWGLAGARVGYVVGAPEVIRWLRAAGPPYGVAAPSLALAAAVLAEGEARMQAYVATVRDERARLYAHLAQCKARPVRSQGNFVFARWSSNGHALWVRDALAALGIGIRAFPGDPTMGDGVRITCPGNAAEFARLTAALTAAATRSAWVFSADLDELMAARRAGQIPVALGDPKEAAAAAILAQGVARVVLRPHDLEESFL